MITSILVAVVSTSAAVALGVSPRAPTPMSALPLGVPLGVPLGDCLLVGTCHSTPSPGVFVLFRKCSLVAIVQSSPEMKRGQ